MRSLKKELSSLSLNKRLVSYKYLSWGTNSKSAPRRQIESFLITSDM